MTLQDHFTNNIQWPATVWHPTLNGELTPEAVSPGSKKRVWWRCERGHDWQAPVYSVTNGSGCPYCAGKRPIVGETDLATTHPQLMPMWSPRNTIAPTAITAGSRKKVWWRCERSHEWEAEVFTVATGTSGCPYCAGKRAIPGENDLATMRPDLMEQWDYDRNADIAPVELLPSSHDKVWWRCELGHNWQAVVFSRTKESGSGCPYCTGKKVLAGFNDLGTLKPELANEWYQPLNGDLTPRDVTLGSNKKVWWRCGERHVWQAAIYSRTRKKSAGCPVCAGMVKQSFEKPTRKRGYTESPVIRQRQ